jgi:D-3-phosphoglycerate dehydrogenase / 2-oxoglutarate reductase
MTSFLYLTEAIHQDAQELLRKNAVVDIGHDRLSRAEILARVAPAEVILSKTDPVVIDAELMAAAPNLRMVARHGTGYSNIDIDYATANGIAVSITAGVNSVAIAEYTVGLMLASARLIPQARAACSAGAPDRQQFLGVQITGKTFGIIGVGRIGRAVIERVSALGMKVLAFHPRPSARNLADLPLELVDLDILLQRSDVVSLHMPLTPDTVNLIGATELAMMKPQAILLNLSRGGVVDEEALYQALSNKRIFAAATDVLAQEPVRSEEPLLGLANCIVLPHIAAMTLETQREIAMTAVGQCLEALAGKVPHNIVNSDALKNPKWTTLT